MDKTPEQIAREWVFKETFPWHVQDKIDLLTAFVRDCWPKDDARIAQAAWAWYLARNANPFKLNEVDSAEQHLYETLDCVKGPTAPERKV